MKKENMPIYIFGGVFTAVNAAAFSDIYIKINEQIWPAIKDDFPGIRVNEWNSLLLAAIILMLFWACIQVALISADIYKWWDTIFWPFISETKRPVDPSANYINEVLPAKKVSNLTYIGGKTCKTFYLDKYTFCNIRTDDGKMYLITGPNVEIKAAGSKVTEFNPMTLTPMTLTLK